jgi:hypothetical protein
VHAEEKNRLANAASDLGGLPGVKPFFLCLICGWQHQCWVYPNMPPSVCELNARRRPHHMKSAI